MKILKIILATTLYIALVYYSWNFLSADESYMTGQKKLTEGNTKKALVYANKSINKNPREPRYRYGKAKILLASTISNTNKEEIKGEAYKEIQRAEDLNKKNLVTLRNIVPIYYFLGINDLTQPESKNNIDEKYIKNIEFFFNKIKKNYPNDVGVHVLTAKYEGKLYLEGEKKSKEKIKELRPDLLEWKEELQQITLQFLRK